MIDPDELLCLLSIDVEEELLVGRSIRKLFALYVLRPFIDRMEKGDPDGPPSRQALAPQDEPVTVPGFSTDPLEEQHNVVSGSLHKYHNRMPLLVKGGCVVNCCYCFCRYSSYTENQSNKRNRQTALEYVIVHPGLDEMIFPSGDPLMVKDHRLDWLFIQLGAIPYIKRLRIRSRLSIVVPACITDALTERFSHSVLQTLLVNHINYIDEIGETFHQVMTKLHRVGATLPNQSVLLRGMDDSAQTLVSLNSALPNTDVMSYYLHAFNKV